MNTIEKVSLEKVQKTYTMGYNYKSTINEFTRIVYFTNGGKIEAKSLLREIGNNNLDNWNNVEKISRSTSNKNIKNYLSQFVNQLTIIGII